MTDEPGRTAAENAVEFGRHERGGGWALALLVACSVTPSEAGRPPKNRSDRTDSSGPKISANAFARTSGTTHGRVLRYFEGWEKAAKDGIVPRAAKLVPADVDTIELPDAAWDDYFDASKSGGRPRATRGEIVERAKHDAEYRDALLDELYAEPKIAKAIDDKVTTGLGQTKEPREPKEPRKDAFDLWQLFVDANAACDELVRVLPDYEPTGDWRDEAQRTAGITTQTSEFLRAWLTGKNVADDADRVLAEWSAATE